MSELESKSSNHSSGYVLPQTREEIKRLSAQYFQVQQILDRTSPLPASVDLSKLSNVLDVGAGSLVWTLELASIPEVRKRLSPLHEDPITLYACDLTDVKFPEKEVFEAMGIKTFLQDVTMPFPENFRSKFDLVHMSFLVFGLTEEGWKKALQNMSDIIKPGGLLFLWEIDPILYPPENPPPEDGRHDLDAMMRGPFWYQKANAVYTGTALQRGMIYNLSYRMGEFLSMSSFEVVGNVRSVYPVGKLCEVTQGLQGGSLDDMADFSTENLMQILELFSRAQLKNSTMEAPLWSSEAEMTAFLQEVEKHVEEEGLSLIFFETLARKHIQEKAGQALS